MGSWPGGTALGIPPGGAKGLVSLAREIGFRDLSPQFVLATDSSAAKSFVCRRGLGKMRHIEIRDLWLQKEVRESKVEVSKIPGIQDTADLLIKVLSIKDHRGSFRGSFDFPSSSD